jgi:hypothetical protein
MSKQSKTESRPKAESQPKKETKPKAGSTKKDLILAVAKEVGAKSFTPAEIEQIRRQLIVRLGPAGKTSAEYIAGVLSDAKLPVALTHHVDEMLQYDHELHDLLHFSTFEEAEMCIIRMDELMRKFRAENVNRMEEYLREVALLGRRRAEMIARNRSVDPQKRAQKEEIAHWFGIWLETPDAFFDWLEMRKQSPEFQAQFGALASEEA